MREQVSSSVWVSVGMSRWGQDGGYGADLRWRARWAVLAARVAVVPAPDVALDLDAVREYLDGPLRHRLPPRLCARVRHLPRGSTGRVDRPSVRAWLENSCSTTKGNADVG